MKALELLAYLNNLTLVGYIGEGEYEWVGTDKQWNNAFAEIDEKEMQIAREEGNEYHISYGDNYPPEGCSHC